MMAKKVTKDTLAVQERKEKWAYLVDKDQLAQGVYLVREEKKVQ